MTVDAVDIRQLGIPVDGSRIVTQELQQAIYAHSNLFIPAGRYRIDDEIHIPSRRRIEGVGYMFNPTQGAPASWIVWDGPVHRGRAIFRVATKTMTQRPAGSTTNVWIKNILLDGNGIAEYGLFAHSITDSTKIEGVLVRGTTRYAFWISNAWYCVFRDLVARGNSANGMAVGRSWWIPNSAGNHLPGHSVTEVAVNGCLFENLQFHGCGHSSPPQFAEFDDPHGTFGKNTDEGYGLGYFGNVCNTFVNVVIEASYGPGLFLSPREVGTTTFSGLYLEHNGTEANIDRRAHCRWGIFYDGLSRTRGIKVDGCYMASPQSIRLTGVSPYGSDGVWFSRLFSGNSTPRNAANYDGAEIRADWPNYRLEAHGFSGKINGVQPS